MKIQNSKFKIQNWGFTLIELLVVISIIGILAAIALASFTTAQRQARDTERKSDIKQYQTSLETFANKSTTYPSKTGFTDASTLCSILGISGTCPKDPSKDLTYYYISNGSGSPATDATNYVLWATLESQDVYFVVCSSGKVGTTVTQPNSPVCPI